MFQRIGYIGQIPLSIDTNAPPMSPTFCLNIQKLEETMAVITKKDEQAKSARVDKAMGAMKQEKQAGTLRHISIRPAENGYTVGVDREPDEDDRPKGGKGNMPMASSYEPPKDHVFSGKTAKQDVLNHIGKHLD